MKRVVITLLSAILIFSSVACAEFKEVNTTSAVGELADMVSDPDTMITDYENMKSFDALFFYYVGLHIYSDYETTFKASTMEDVYIGIGHIDDEACIYFFIPTPDKKIGNDDQLYRMAFYPIAMRKIFYDPRLSYTKKDMLAYGQSAFGDLFIAIDEEARDLGRQAFDIILTKAYGKDKLDLLTKWLVADIDASFWSDLYTGK